MKGTHTVVVERAKVKYTLTFKRNISFMRGNSGTGKTTLISMIRDYNDRGQESGVKLSCDVPCETLSGRRWERFFTDVLIKYSADTRYAYRKAKLNEQYLKPQAMDAVGSVLPECLRAE